MVKRKTRQPPQETRTAQLSLAESKFKKIVHENFSSLCSALSSDDSRPEIANAFIAFLDRGAQKILVRNRKSNERFDVSYFDVWDKNLMVCNPEDYQKYVLSYPGSAEGRLLLPVINELGDASIEMGIKWERAEILLREFLSSVARAPGPRSASLGSRLTDETLEYGHLEGERDPNVAARRAELRNIMRSGRRLSAREICERWDFKKIGVPESWQLAGILDWKQALRLRTSNVYKLISVDKKSIRMRRK